MGLFRDARDALRMVADARVDAAQLRVDTAHLDPWAVSCDPDRCGAAAGEVCDHELYRRRAQSEGQ